MKRRGFSGIAAVALSAGLLTGLIPTVQFDEDAGGACGVERWSVKTGTDADANAIDLDHVVPTTIADLTRLAKPASLPSNNRIAPTETTVYSEEVRGSNPLRATEDRRCQPFNRHFRG